MRVEFATTLAQVDPAQWNGLWHDGYPFARFEFLAALEQSGCTAPSAGWEAQHCLIYDGNQLVAAMPLYAKTHSYGEYVFDWNWANAYHENGFRYYPKLINAIPFTPATGPRWGTANHLPQQQRHALVHRLFETVKQHVHDQGYSSFHSLFAESTQRTQVLAITPEQGMPLPLRPRLDCQFHWLNQGFSSFTDFLSTFNARKRKNVIKERRKITEQNIQVAMVEGSALSARDWQHFYELYQRTYLKRSGHTGYLNEAFFQMLGRDLPSNIVMAKATRGQEWIAAALYLRDEQTLYGRYWGATEELDSVHFECCYYQGIEYAIANNLQRFDPGAQGEHKIARGFTPVLTSSLHHIAHPGFDRAIGDFLQQEEQHVLQYCQQAREELPFKEGTAIAPARCLIDSAPDSEQAHNPIST